MSTILTFAHTVIGRLPWNRDKKDAKNDDRGEHLLFLPPPFATSLNRANHSQSYEMLIFYIFTRFLYYFFRGSTKGRRKKRIFYGQADRRGGGRGEGTVPQNRAVGAQFWFQADSSVKKRSVRLGWDTQCLRIGQ